MHTYINTYNTCIFPIEIPPVENLTAVDKCTNVTASWSITEGPCRGLSYNVTLTSSDGVLGPFTTNDTTYNFTNVETLNGMFNVTVFAFNENTRGVNVTVTTVNSILSYG